MATKRRRNCKRSMYDVTDEEIIEMHKLSMNGMNDNQIADKFGLNNSAVNLLLARVAPDGRIMPTMYG